MKKVFFFALGAMVLLLSSCGSGNKTNEETEVSFEQTKIDHDIKQELDSVAEIISGLQPVSSVLDSRSIQLSVDEQKVKPDYLFDPGEVGDIITLTQAYRAVGMMNVDMKVAALYGMNLDGYKSAIVKLSAEINDPDINLANPKTMEDMSALYKAEDENYRIDLFWELAAASTIETFYVISQNLDTFIPAFDDHSAAALTYHLALVKQAVDRLVEYDDEMETLDETLAPLDDFNAVNVQELSEQLAGMKEQIETARMQLLK